MALIDKITAIADGFRSSRGTTDKYTLDQMATLAAETVGTEEIIHHADIPGYTKNAALEVARRVQAVQTDDSITFIAMSDSHYPAEQTATLAYESNVKSSIQANQAAKILAYALNVDFVTHLGDISAGALTTTPDMLKSQIEEFLEYFQEVWRDLPVFLAIGNHDTGIVYHQSVDDGNIYTMTGDYLYQNFTSRSASDNTVFGNAEYGGYCYRDFPDKKLRVILLNTSEKLVSVQTDLTTYGAQRVWLANALLDLNSKADSDEWKFIILCHYPADYGETMPLSKLLEAYVNGASFTITDAAGGYYQGDGTNQTIDFTGKNAAQFMGQFHGHIHNFLASQLYSNASGAAKQYNAWRICTPNAQFDRENTYGTSGGINFAEATSYLKTADAATGTSFVINVINPSEQMIYSFCFGAGYDRAISLAGDTYYSIQADLTYATLESETTSVKEGGSYTGQITLNEGYTLESVVVTMGGEDITGEVYDAAAGTITIPAVTGTVVITVVAEAPPENLIPLSLDTDGSLYNGGQGYKAGLRISSSGGGESELTGSYVSGFIPVDLTADTLILKNVGTEVVGGKTALLLGFTAMDATKVHGQVILADIEANDDGTLTVTGDTFALNNSVFLVKYVRLSCSYIGADSEIYKA